MPSNHQLPDAQLNDIVIDAHQHLWTYQVDEFSWIPDAMAVLRQDFTAHDLTIEMEGAGIHAAVAVQARQSLQETYWLLEQPPHNPASPASLAGQSSPMTIFLKSSLS